MLEIWKGASKSNKAFGALLTDISKAFDCLSHDLLIAMLHAYGLDKNSLNILQDYLSNRKQRIKVEAILSRESQGSILGPRLFNVFMGDMLMILKVTDSTPFVVRDNSRCYKNFRRNKRKPFKLVFE